MNNWIDYLFLTVLITLAGMITFTVAALALASLTGQAEGLGYGEQNYLPVPRLTPSGYYLVY